MFAPRHNHAFRNHQPDKENMIAQTPLRPGLAFKTPMTQRTLHPSSSKLMMNGGGGMHTVGPKRVQMSEKDGSKTELKSRIGPSLNRNGSNVGGASPFAGKGKGKAVELGKPQQLGNGDGVDANLGPKRLFTNTSRTTPLKQTNPPLSFSTNPLPTVASTPLPSATRSRRRSRYSSSSTSPGTNSNKTPGRTNLDNFLQTPGPARHLDNDKFKTPCRPSSSYTGGGYPSLYSPGDEDLLEDDEDEDSDHPVKRSGGLSFRQELAGLGGEMGQDVDLGMGIEMMQLNVQEVEQEDEDEIEYMPPRAQELPHEPPFTYTPLSTIGKALMYNIRGDYLVGEEDEGEFDGYVNGQKWDVLELGEVDDLKAAGNGMRVLGKLRSPIRGKGTAADRDGALIASVESEEPFLLGIVAGKRAEEKRRLESKSAEAGPSGQAKTAQQQSKPVERALPGGQTISRTRIAGGAAGPVKKHVSTLPAGKARPGAQAVGGTVARPMSGVARPGSTVPRPTSTVSRPTSTVSRPTSTVPRPTSTVSRLASATKTATTTTTTSARPTTARPAGRVPLRTLSKNNLPATKPTELAQPKTMNVPKKEVFEVMSLELDMPDEGGLTELAL